MEVEATNGCHCWEGDGGAVVSGTKIGKDKCGLADFVAKDFSQEVEMKETNPDLAIGCQGRARSSITATTRSAIMSVTAAAPSQPLLPSSSTVVILTVSTYLASGKHNARLTVLPSQCRSTSAATDFFGRN